MRAQRQAERRHDGEPDRPEDGRENPEQAGKVLRLRPGRVEGRLRPVAARQRKGEDYEGEEVAREGVTAPFAFTSLRVPARGEM